VRRESEGEPESAVADGDSVRAPRRPRAKWNVIGVIDIDLLSLYLLAMTAVTVSSKYQIVIPREARLKLGISTGTRLQAIPEASGLRLVKEPSIDEIPGILKGMPVRDFDVRQEDDRILP
jgi:AbrB family looped-hinge helix DNA binding protein